MFVRVQEPEYYDKIMLLVAAKFAEIVKIGKTIKDGLKSGKIDCVAASLGSSRLLEKKEKMWLLFHTRARKTLEYLHTPIPKVVLDLLRTLIKLVNQIILLPHTKILL